MLKLENILGTSYGFLTIVGCVENDEKRIEKVICSCSCGTSQNRTYFLSNLRSGHTKSCGCYNKNAVSKRNYKHGLSKHKFFDMWNSMCQRCHNENNPSYKEYGGRGIYVCNEWRKSVKSFIEWAENSSYKEGFQIDRIDNDGPYSPDNCRFVSGSRNVLNQRTLKASNKTGYCGVSLVKRDGTYNARVVYKNKLIYNKRGFKTPEQGAIARDIFIIFNKLPHKVVFKPYIHAYKNLIKDITISWAKYGGVKDQKEFAMIVKNLPINFILFSMKKGLKISEIFDKMQDESKLELLEKYK